jgi:hypothetical protein
MADRVEEPVPPLTPLLRAKLRAPGGRAGRVDRPLHREQGVVKVFGEVEPGDGINKPTDS